MRQLRRAFRGQPVLLLWDGLSSHHSQTMQAYLATQTAWLEVERLPAYAPDLNPVEGLWANLKGTELANRCDLDIADTVLAAKLCGDEFPAPTGPDKRFLVMGCRACDLAANHDLPIGGIRPAGSWRAVEQAGSRPR